MKGFLKYRLDDGNVFLKKDINSNKINIKVEPKIGNFCQFKEYTTSYPLDLIEKILSIKGACWTIDEIRRQESSDYVEKALYYGLFSFIAKDKFKNKILLDFGCGSGASTCIVSKFLPKTEIIGIDLDKNFIEIADMRSEKFKLNNVSFIHSTDPEVIPLTKKVDFILLSAVFEHLLPIERKKILSMCWSILKPNGVIFINQTPKRWILFENHTTLLLFINYLPDKLACWFARNFSSKNLKNLSWNELLRKGIRGGSKKEIFRILLKITKRKNFKELSPNNFGIKREVDLWYRSTSLFSPSTKIIKKIIQVSVKIFPPLSILLLPTLVMAIKKK